MNYAIDRTRFKGKLLFWDIETSFIHVVTHYIGSKVSIHPQQIMKEKRIICISYKAEGWKKAKTLYWDKNQDDKKLLKDFSKVARKYDVLVAQNGDAFDIKVFTGRLWQQKVPPLNNILTLDTLKMSRQNMKLSSHRLDYKSKLMGREGKYEMHMGDWLRVEEGNKKALKKMGHYCEIDVEELQELFWSLLPYCNKLPVALNVMLTGDRNDCPKCSNSEIKRNGTRPSTSGLRQRWYCGCCGHDWTDSRALSTTDKI